MQSLLKTILVAVCLALFPLFVTACGKQAAAENSDTKVKGAPAVVISAASPSALLAVNDLAASPSAHLGPVSLVGVVGTVSEKKGFVIVDTREYKECGLSCLTEAGTKKIPVRWTGAVPQVKDTVRIDGELQKDEKGYALLASKVAKQ